MFASSSASAPEVVVMAGSGALRQRPDTLDNAEIASPACRRSVSPSSSPSSRTSSRSGLCGSPHRSSIDLHRHLLLSGDGLDERAFFTEKPETRQGRYQCPKCRRSGDYSIRWVRRTKKDRPPPGADDADRAKFAKLRDYLLRLDDEVACKTCGKKFEIPSQHSLMFVDQLAGLPNDDELEREIADADTSGDAEPAPERKPSLPARFTRGSSGWK